MLAIVVAATVARVTLGKGALCPDHGSYWVQPQEESPTAFTAVGDAGVELTAYCVPTAVGNLMSHMAAVHTGGAIGYSDNYDLDTFSTPGNEYEFHDPIGTQWLDGTNNLDQRYLGGAWHPTNTKNVGFLMGWKNEPVVHGVGVKVSDIQTGLQQWLDNTQSPGTAVTTLQPAGTTDVDFLKSVAPPYMMHIKASCIKSDAAGDGMWKYNDGAPTFADIKSNDGLEEGALAGSTLGHTVVVYKNLGVDQSSLDKWRLSGASGLGASRNPATNERDCNAVTFNLVNDQKCIEGITRIEASPADDDSSKSLSTGEIIGIVVGAGVGVIVVIVVVVMLRNRAGVSVKYTRNLM